MHRQNNAVKWPCHKLLTGNLGDYSSSPITPAKSKFALECGDAIFLHSHSLKKSIQK